MSNLRVLVIDDSAYNRRTISEILANQPDIEVVGKAFDGEEGLKLALQLKPDLITLDIEMPRMDGFTFLRILMNQLPTPVVVISSHSKKHEVFQALELGALDFIAKPTQHLGPDIETLKEDLIAKVRTVRGLQRIAFERNRQSGMKLPPLSESENQKKQRSRAGMAKRVVCLGASTGGPPALEAIVKRLPCCEPTAVIIAQHMPEKFTKAFADRLNRMVDFDVVEAEDNMEIRGQTVFVSPGGFHTECKPIKAGGFQLCLSKPSETDRYIPSIDRLFVSTAMCFGKATLGVVLTGMGADGSSGVKAIKNAKGQTLAESQETAVVFGMPKEAMQTGYVDHMLPLQAIVEKIHAFSLCSPDE